MTVLVTKFMLSAFNVNLTIGCVWMSSNEDKNKRY